MLEAGVPGRWVAGAFLWKVGAVTEFAVGEWAAGSAVGQVRSKQEVGLGEMWLDQPPVSVILAEGTDGKGVRVVAGGGANTVPVYSDGTNWRIG